MHELTCHANVQDLEETKREAAQVVELLDLRQGGLTQTLDGGFPSCAPASGRRDQRTVRCAGA